MLNQKIILNASEISSLKNEDICQIFKSNNLNIKCTDNNLDTDECSRLFTYHDNQKPHLFMGLCNDDHLEVIKISFPLNLVNNKSKLIRLINDNDLLKKRFKFGCGLNFIVDDKNIVKVLIIFSEYNNCILSTIIIN